MKADLAKLLTDPEKCEKLLIKCTRLVFFGYTMRANRILLKKDWGLESNVKLFCLEKSHLGGVLWKLVQLRRITDVGMERRLQPLSNFCDFSRKNLP